MKNIITWVLKKTGVYQFVWNDFCDKYPVRISAETPELQAYLKTQSKVFTDTMIYGMGCTHYVDPKGVFAAKDVVRH